jgi:hypothetical protein
MDTAARKRAERLRKQDLGLRRYELWLLPEQWRRVMDFIRTLRTPK